MISYLRWWAHECNRKNIISSVTSFSNSSSSIQTITFFSLQQLHYCTCAYIKGGRVTSILASFLSCVPMLLITEVFTSKSFVHGLLRIINKIVFFFFFSSFFPGTEHTHLSIKYLDMWCVCNWKINLEIEHYRWEGWYWDRAKDRIIWITWWRHQ